MNAPLSRRSFLATTAASVLAADLLAADAPLDFPLVDFHVHAEGRITPDRAVEIAKRRGMKFGIVEHAGTKELKYPRILSNDDELRGYLKELDGRPVYKGVQAEWIDWMSYFSREMIARLDYVLTDAMTFRGRDGRPYKLWEGKYDLGPTQKFMDAFVDFHVEILASEPIDILANTSWLPGPIAEQYDALWTEARVKKVVDAAIKHGVALEISSSYKLPKLRFLQIAKEAGAKFSFGSNIRGEDVGMLDYCVMMARQLGLRRGDMFTPAPAGKKAIDRWKA